MPSERDPNNDVDIYSLNEQESGVGTASRTDTGVEGGRSTRSRLEGGLSSVQRLLSSLFKSCEGDPKGSVHRAWGVSLILVIVFFVVAIVEVFKLQTKGGSKALEIAAIWTALAHLLLSIVGTFILKRFPTSFSVGFFLGLVVVVANQNLVLYATFHGYGFGSSRTNRTFANLALALFFIFTFFALILAQFKEHIIMAPVDVKGLGGRGREGEESVDGDESYQKYDEGQ